MRDRPTLADLQKRRRAWAATIGTGSKYAGDAPRIIEWLDREIANAKGKQGLTPKETDDDHDQK